MIGEKLGTYRIDAVLGTGAMGVVYRATSETTARSAAVKVISGEIAQRGKSYERFRREAEILQQFRHPNIVRFLALGRYKGTSYFAMEYIPGETLEALLAKRGALPWREVVHLGIQICDALQYAHDHGVVHRDLKPSNLMVTAQGQLKLTDFGIAKDLDATALTATGRTLGTAAYMAPEQIRGAPEVSHKTDLYALGIVLYQMLTGQPAFEGTSAVVLMHCHLNESPPRPSLKVPEIPKALDNLIVQLMAKAPADRPWDAAAVGATLTALREQMNRGEKIDMVWSEQQANSAHPARLGLDPVKKPKKKVKPRSEPTIARSTRAWVEIGLLVLGLLAIGGLIGYELWPPSAKYLFEQAKTLMDSPERHKWEIAREDYIEPLNKRYPNNPYHETTQSWLDRILLADAEGRASMLEAGPVTKYNHPRNHYEERFVHFYGMASKDETDGKDLSAFEQWERMKQSLDRQNREERPWYLLAQKRAEELQQRMDERRKFVREELVRAHTKEQLGEVQEAAKIRAELVKTYSRFADVADLLADYVGPPEGPVQEPATERAPAPQAVSPGSPTAPDQRATSEDAVKNP